MLCGDDLEMIGKGAVLLAQEAVGCRGRLAKQSDFPEFQGWFEEIGDVEIRLRRTASP